MNQQTTQKFIFLNIKGNRFTRTKILYNGLLKLGLNCNWYEFSSFREFRYFLKDRKSIYSEEILIATSRSQILAIYSFILGCRIVLDAGLPLWDGVITSRKNFGFLAQNAIKTYMIDFIAYQASKLLIFETESQIDRVARMFCVNKRKIKSLYIGVDESRFRKLFQQQVSFSRKPVLNILFRGGNQVESGIPILLEAIEKLESDDRFDFTILSQNLNYDRNLKNLNLVNDFVSDEVLCKYIAKSDIYVGQLLDHSRLYFAIPHKFYEAAFFSKPYLTGYHGLMKEFVSLGIVMGFKAGSADSLINKLNLVFENQKILEQYSYKIGEWYKSYSSEEILADKFYRIVAPLK